MVDSVWYAVCSVVARGLRPMDNYYMLEKKDSRGWIAWTGPFVLLSAAIGWLVAREPMPLAGRWAVAERDANDSLIYRWEWF